VKLKAEQSAMTMKRANGANRPAEATMQELKKNAIRVAALLKAMANPARLGILCLLAEAERSVGELERAVGLSQSGISQHLALLRRRGIVASRREGQTVYYALASRDVVTLMGTLHSVFCRESPARAPVRAGTQAS
jgi:DNA-binding transcriptional ArsR family regulator